MRTRMLGFALLLAGCKCLTVPTTDPTPPTAGLIIEYVPAGGGARTTLNVSNQSTDVTVDAKRNEVVTVLYSGGDNEGVRRVDLEYDMWYYNGNQRVSPLLAAIGRNSDCPLATLLGSHNFEASSSPWTFTFISSATNWLGANTKSAKVTVRTQ